MFKKIRQQQGIILAVIMTLSVIIIAGYFSAVKRSEPKFRSKVDQMLFEEGNLSPRYVITLPDHQTKKAITDKVTDTSTTKKQEDDGLTTQQRVLMSVPVLSKLTAIEGLSPLKNIGVNSELLEKDSGFIIPRKNDMMKPWVEYGHKVKVQPNFFRVTIIFKNFGIDKTAYLTILKGMPENVSFSFSPYAQEIEKRIKEARESGHETYLDLLLPSQNYLSADTGPLAMDITVSPEELIRRLKESLSINAPLGGMIVGRGDAGADSLEHLGKVLNEVENRGLLMLNASEEETVEMIKVPGLARNKADIIIDDNFNLKDITHKLEIAEMIARNKGQVIVVAEPKPIVILEIRKWIDTFSKQMTYEELREQNINAPEKPFALVPLSNVVIE